MPFFTPILLTCVLILAGIAYAVVLLTRQLAHKDNLREFERRANKQVGEKLSH